MVQTSSYAPTYLPLFHTYQEEFLHRLATLVNIDSGTGQVAGVTSIMTYLEQWLRELDFAVTLHPGASFGPNLVARRKGSGQKRILLVGHVDTVYTAGSAQARPFVVQDGLAYGPGVIDMKSGVLLCIYALRALLEAGFDGYGELIVVFNNDEEVGSPGSAPLLRDIARQAEVGLVLEPSRALKVLTQSRKGSDKYVLEVTGIAAHSGVEPYKGRSAVVDLAHKIIAIQNLHAIFPGVTFNVTRLSSTEPLNIVPDMARCHISVRAFSTRALDEARAALETIVAASSVPGTRAALTYNPGRRPYEPTPGIMALFSHARVEGEALGLQMVAEAKGGVSDANTLIEAGISALDSLGPIGGSMHNLELEYLRVESIPLRGALLAGLVQRICLS